MGLFRRASRSRFPADIVRRLEDFGRHRLDATRHRIDDAVFDIPAALALIDAGIAVEPQRGGEDFARHENEWRPEIQRIGHR